MRCGGPRAFLTGADPTQLRLRHGAQQQATQTLSASSSNIQPTGGPQPWLLGATFGPLDEMLLHIARDGSLQATDAGMLLYVSPTSGKGYEVLEAIDTYAEIFALVRSRDLTCPDVAALQRVATHLRAGAVSEDEIEAALASLAAIPTYTASKPAHVAADAACGVALRLHMDATEMPEASDHGSA